MRVREWELEGLGGKMSFILDTPGFRFLQDNPLKVALEQGCLSNRTFCDD